MLFPSSLDIDEVPNRSVKSPVRLLVVPRQICETRLDGINRLDLGDYVAHESAPIRQLGTGEIWNVPDFRPNRAVRRCNGR